MKDARPRARDALLCALAVAACGRPAAAPDPSRGTRDYVVAQAVRVSPGRWFPVVSPDEPHVSEVEPDGSVLSVEHGLRLVRHPDGRIERSGELLPEPAAVGVLRLPARFGGGFVFRATADGTTSLYRAERFTDPLQPLVRLPFEAADLVVGLDRLYAVSSRTRAVVGIDPASGDISSGTGSLPVAAGYGGLAGRDGWIFAVETDVRGVLVTFDAGESFHPLGIATTTPSILSQGGRIVIGTPKGARELLPSGELRDMESPSLDAMFKVAETGSTEDVLPEDQAAAATSGAMSDGEPLEIAARYGMPDSADSAIVVRAGTLSRISLDDGRVLATVPHAVPEDAVCQGIPLGKGIGFVCGQEGGRTSVLVLRRPLAVAPVLELDGPRRVMPNGRGALAIDQGCSPVASSRAKYCIVGSSGSPHEVDVSGDVGVERVVALEGGGAAVLVPPRLGAPGTIAVVGTGGKPRGATLALSGLGAGVQHLLERGLWLDGMIEIEPGTLGGWVFGGSSFVGVRVKLDGAVLAGSPRSGPEHAVVSGRFALLRCDSGIAAETTDGGMSWSDVVLPETADANDLDGARGCTPVGCSFGSWLRIGWGSSAKDLSPARQPPDAKIESQKFVSWRFECAPTGETEMSRAPLSVAHPRPAKADKRAPAAAPRDVAGLESSAFRPFLGVPPPERAEGELGFDFGTEDHVVQIRGYAWGPRGVAWDRSASWVVRGIDRFEVSRAIWSTAVSRTPWADAAAAAEVFGSEPTHRVVNEWGAVLDPDGEGGVLLMRTGTRTDLAVMERDHAIVFVKNADEFTLDRPAGAVKVGGRWYLGVAPGPRTFEVFAIDNGLLSRVASFPRVVEDAPARIVRSERGDALGLWVIAHGQFGMRGGGDTWLVYPIDQTAGQALPPLVVPRNAMSRAPVPCSGARDGWVLLHDVSPSVAKIEVTNIAAPPSMQHLEARLIAGPLGLCLDALAAQVEGEPPKSLPARNLLSRARSVPLALTDRATDRRFGFRCAP